MPEPILVEQAYTKPKEKPKHISPEEMSALSSLLDPIPSKDKSGYFLSKEELSKEHSIKERKERYLRQLPENIIELLQGHLMNELTMESKSFNEENEIRAEQGRITIFREELTLEELVRDELNEQLAAEQPKSSGLLRGELFEMLCEIQAKSEGYRVKNKGLSPEQKESLEKKSGLLLAVAHNPEVFGFSKYRSVRNPDLAWMQVDGDGNLVVKAIAEAKSSKHLDSRAYRQIHKSGFRTTLSDLADSINQLPNADEHGLEGFGVGGAQIIVDPEVIQYVIVCRGVKPTNNEGYAKLVKPQSYDKRPLSSAKQADFVRLLSSDEHTKMIESPFSNDELVRITKHIMGKLAKTDE